MTPTRAKAELPVEPPKRLSILSPTYEGIKQELADNIELIESGRMEGDEEVFRGQEGSLENTGQTGSPKRSLRRCWNGEADANA